MEGGNVAKDSVSAVSVPSLNLLTTNYRPLERLFTTTNATSPQISVILFCAQHEKAGNAFQDWL
jgi:hypothetical protein